MTTEEAIQRCALLQAEITLAMNDAYNYSVKHKVIMGGSTLVVHDGDAIAIRTVLDLVGYMSERLHVQSEAICCVSEIAEFEPDPLDGRTPDRQAADFARAKASEAMEVLATLHAEPPTETRA